MRDGGGLLQRESLRSERARAIRLQRDVVHFLWQHLQRERGLLRGAALHPASGQLVGYVRFVVDGLGVRRRYGRRLDVRRRLDARRRLDTRRGYRGLFTLWSGLLLCERAGLLHRNDLQRRPLPLGEAIGVAR